MEKVLLAVTGLHLVMPAGTTLAARKVALPAGEP
jgi:hypothetical protein